MNEKMTTVRTLFTCLSFLLPGLLFSQILNPTDEQGVHCSAILIEGDTVPVMYLDQVYVWGSKSFKNSAEARKWDRLVRNVKVAYPYARLAGIKFEESNKLISNVSSEREKKKLMKQAEDELQAQFGDELKALTFTQGKILIKLVDRQTRNTSFEIVREFRGRFVAFFWQGIGKIFGYNLKARYDPLHEDAEIERIVLMIENGTI